MELYGAIRFVFGRYVPSPVPTWNFTGPSLVKLWDAGTEKNQPPGLGPDQAPRQSAANTGEAEQGKVAPVTDGFTYPEVGQVLSVTITPL